MTKGDRVVTYRGQSGRGTLRSDWTAVLPRRLQGPSTKVPVVGRDVSRRYGNRSRCRSVRVSTSCGRGPGVVVVGHLE